MNEDHKNNIKDYLSNLLKLEIKEDSNYWMAGIDQLGADFMLDKRLNRLNFDKELKSPEQARELMVELAKRARS